MQTIDLTDAEHAAVTTAIKCAIDQEKFPRARRLDPLRSALAKLDPAAAAALTRTALRLALQGVRHASTLGADRLIRPRRPSAEGTKGATRH
jgi:hypothetical protein